MQNRILKLCLLLCITGCQKPQVLTKRFPVEVTQASKADIPIFLNGVGHLLASEEVEVHPEVQGIIKQMHFKDGMFVEEGDLLIEIDDRKYQTCVEESEAKVHEEEARVRFCHAVVQRMADLVGKDYVSAIEYEGRVKDLEESKQRLQEAIAAHKRCQVDLSHTKIHAPISGYVSERRLDPGNFVTSYEAPLLTIRRVSPIIVDFSLPGKHLDAIKERQRICALPLTAKRCVPDCAPLYGELTFIQNRIHPETGMIQLRGKIENSEEKGWPGEFVRVSIQLGTKKAATYVPSQAVVIGEGKRFLFIVNENQTHVEMREVHLGLTYGDYIEVVEGVEPGETIVTDGQLNLYHEAPIQILSNLHSTQVSLLGEIV